MFTVKRLGDTAAHFVTFNKAELCRRVKAMDGIVEVSHNGHSLGFFMKGKMVAAGCPELV